jgi:hypothetical protein
MDWKSIFSGGVENSETLAAIPTVELTVGDTFGAKVSITDSGGLLFRNAACGMTWPIGVIAPVLKTDNSLTYTDVDSKELEVPLFQGFSYDLGASLVGSVIGITKTLKSGASVASTGVVAIIEFKAIAAGEGEIVLLDPEANDIENGILVKRITAIEDSVNLNVAPIIQPTGTVLFRVKVVV